jgi:hypothetical protein
MSSFVNLRQYNDAILYGSKTAKNIYHNHTIVESFLNSFEKEATWTRIDWRNWVKLLCHYSHNSYLKLASRPVLGESFNTIYH